MGRLIIDLAINFLICILVVKISLKLEWNKRLWSQIQRNNKIKDKMGLYVIAVFIITLLVLVICRAIGLGNKSIGYRIINSIRWALVISFIPGLPKLFE